MRKNILLIVIAAMIVISGCSGITDTITNAQRLQWKLGSVSGMTVSGVDVSNVSSFSSINPLDLVKLTSAVGSGQLPVSFTLNLLAKNPEGEGGSKNSSDLIKSVDWRLLIDNKETINGVVSGPITVPGVGQTSTIPVGISLDIMQFFQNEGLQSLAGMLLGIGGKSGSPARLSLKIRPTIDTFIGPISPGEITVIDKEFRSK
ncbi:MAG: hypothetical protein WC644_10755 [Ignavibacteria bacterium]